MFSRQIPYKTEYKPYLLWNLLSSLLITQYQKGQKVQKFLFMDHSVIKFTINFWNVSWEMKDKYPLKRPMLFVLLSHRVQPLRLWSRGMIQSVGTEKEEIKNKGLLFYKWFWKAQGPKMG